VGLGPILDTLKRSGGWIKPALGIASFEAERVKGAAPDLGGELGCQLQEGLSRLVEEDFDCEGVSVEFSDCSLSLHQI
jgi:hypothetical protein